METGRKLLGYFGVDSGQVLITDPCYLKEFKSNEMKIDTIYTLKHPDGKTEKVVASMSNKRWRELIDDINNGKIKTIKREYSKTSKDYSYNGCCGVSLSEDRGGQIGKGEDGVCASTGYGDGSYPVYANYEGGRIKSLSIKFF